MKDEEIDDKIFISCAYCDMGNSLRYAPNKGIVYFICGECGKINFINCPYGQIKAVKIGRLTYEDIFRGIGGMYMKNKSKSMILCNKIFNQLKKWKKVNMKRK